MLSCDWNTAVLKAASLWYHELKLCFFSSWPRPSPTPLAERSLDCTRHPPGVCFSLSSSSKSLVTGTRICVCGSCPIISSARAPLGPSSHQRKAPFLRRSRNMLANSRISLAAWPLLLPPPVPFSFWPLTLTSLLSQLLQVAHFPEQLREATCCPWRGHVRVGTRPTTPQVV